MNRSSYAIFIAIVAIFISSSQATKCYTAYTNATVKTEAECPAHDRCYISATFTNSSLDAATVLRGCANSTETTTTCSDSCTKQTADEFKYDCSYCCVGENCNDITKETLDAFKAYYLSKMTSDEIRASGMASVVLSLVYLSITFIMN